MSGIVWLSDLHFSGTEVVNGHDPRQRLDAAISFVNAHYGDASCCVVSGDLVNQATEQNYEALAYYLSRLQMPLYPMVGNHDDRELLRRYIAVPDTAMRGFVQYAVDLQDSCLVCLDTLQKGADHGAFCVERAAWLSDILLRMDEKQTILFLHHPPIELGLPMQDQDRLRDNGRLLNILARNRHVKQMCIGHVHCRVAGSCRGIPFVTCPSVLYQAPAPRPAWDWSSFAPAREAPQLGIVSAGRGDIVVQFQQFCLFEHGVDEVAVG